MIVDTDIQEIEQQATLDQAVPPPTPPSEPEFKVTVRKLELPARPRGVLAE
jgi:hypothetical protein